LPGRSGEAHLRGGREPSVWPEDGGHPLLCESIRRRQGRRGDLSHRSGSVCSRGNAEPALRLAHSSVPRRAVLHPRDDGSGRRGDAARTIAVTGRPDGGPVSPSPLLLYLLPPPLPGAILPP